MLLENNDNAQVSPGSGKKLHPNNGQIFYIHTYKKIQYYANLWQTTNNLKDTNTPFYAVFFSFEFAIVADVAAVDVATTIALALLAYKQYTMNASLEEIF